MLFGRPPVYITKRSWSWKKSWLHHRPITIHCAAKFSSQWNNDRWYYFSRSFSTVIAVYLWNGTRWVNSYYGSLIRSHRQARDRSVTVSMPLSDAMARFYRWIAIRTLVPFDQQR